MYEVSIWVPIVLVEICLLCSGILGFLLWRGGRVRRRLHREVMELRQTRQEHPEGMSSGNVATEAKVRDAGGPEEPANQDASDDESQKGVTQQTIEAMQGMIKQLQEKNLLLLQQMELLETEGALTQGDKEKLSSLQGLLREVEAELHIMQQVNSRLKETLRDEKRRLRMEEDELTISAQRQSLLQGTVKDLRMANARLTNDLEAKDKRLAELEAKMTKYLDIKNENAKLRQQVTKLSTYAEAEKELEALKQELWHVKTKLARREADLHHLQGEYDTLHFEYQRLFQDFQT